MKRVRIICIVIVFMLTACDNGLSNDDDNYYIQIVESEENEAKAEDNQITFNDKIETVNYRDGRTGREFNIADDHLVEFTEIFNGSSFIEQEASDDSVGYVFWVTITTDTGEIVFSRADKVSMYGTPVSFVSHERYSTIEAFLEEYKYIDEE